MSLGPWEIILIVLVVLILFGGKKIPELMRGLGKGMREFNDAKNNVRKEIEESITDREPDTRRTTTTTTTSSQSAQQ